MDDFQISSLNESKNEWCSRLINIFTPNIIDGLKSIFNESLKLCKENQEYDKYLMTFQNFLSRIPKWNPSIIENEKLRIIENSSCKYLEELITCIHIIQLKTLTAMRVGQKQKKIDINIPKLDDFIHKVYINVAKKIYKNVYLFEINIQPLQIQKNNRELELIVQECILNSVRDSIPIESILKVYMDETIEEDVTEEIKEEIISSPVLEKVESKLLPNRATSVTEYKHTDGFTNSASSSSSSSSSSSEAEQNHLEKATETQEKSILFNDIDFAKDVNNNEMQINAPKTIERLEEISQERNLKRKMEEEEDDDDDNVKINILDDQINLDNKEIEDLNYPENLIPDLLLDDIEILT